jgi:Tfp pilus assembly PilM family ATPase
MNFPAFLTTPAPTVALGIDAGRVAAIGVTRTPAGLVVAATAVEPVPPGAVVPALAGANIADRTAVVGAVTRALHRLEVKPRRVGLVIPDTAAKVSVVAMEKVPARADDREKLIRFKVQKSAPFRLEDAQLAYTPGAGIAGGGREFVVVLIRRDIVEEYEAVAAAAGVQAGLVDLATPNVINLLLSDAKVAAGDCLLLHVAPGYATIAILRGGDLIFFRTRAQDGEGNLADLAHQTAMYYEDRLGGTGFARVLLAGGGSALAGGAADEGSMAALKRTLESRLRLDVTIPYPADYVRFADRISVDPDAFVTFAPLVGLLARQATAA